MSADPSVAGMNIRIVLAFKYGATASDSDSGTHEYSLWREADLAVGVVLCVTELQVLWLASTVTIRRHLQCKQADAALTARLASHKEIGR